MPTRIPPSDVPDALISQGRYWANTNELEEMTGQQGAVLRASLGRLRDDGLLFSPARGFYVFVPPEYRSWRVVPADWFIDAMMRHLGRHYYVGLLNAASYHGASHQAPQTFSVLIDQAHRRLEDRDIERVRLRFISSRSTEEMPTQQQTTHTGYVTVATPETTMVDLAWRPRLGVGMSNVATVLKEIEGLDAEKLARAAQLRPRSVARRLGWLVERFRPDLDAHWLRVIAEPAEGEPVPLVPGSRRQGRVDSNWGLRINTVVEPDV
jgi:predicted transcriptional regulator of viral defense system